MVAPTAGRYVSVNIGTDLIPSLKSHFETTVRPGAAQGGCMWWLMHAEVSQGLSLSHHLGVRRSAAPSNLMKKLLHAGNDRVDVIGIAVQDVAAFEKMTDQELLGAPPGGGVMEAIKE